MCYVIEDAYHYFFKSRKYCVERQVFSDTISDFQPLNIIVILYDNGNWNSDVHMVLFGSVYRYIHAAKGF